MSINLSNVPEKNRHNFDKADGTTVLGSPYDFSSVMHYGARDFAINSNINVITTKPAGQSVGQRDGPSNLDIIKLRLLYQCVSGPRNYADYQANPCTSDCKCWEGATGCNGNNAACQGSLVCSNNQCVVGGGGGGTTGGCTDFPDWLDSDRDGCAAYKANNWCEQYGNDFADIVTGKTANEACCHCGGGSTSGPTFYQFKNAKDPSKCLDLRSSSTTNGNRIILKECNGTPAQQWWVDSNWYIRSAVNTNKCSKFTLAAKLVLRLPCSHFTIFYSSVVGTAGLTTAGTDLIINDWYASNDPLSCQKY